ncbi:MAG: transposase [Proteobacteria bacterium]|nr:transposase [Pseudomonadota bacterium]
MPNYRRATEAGGTYFFTINTLYRQTVLLQPEIRGALRRGIEQVRIRYPFAIDAWVLMPDHMHCIWTLPADDYNFSTRWAIIKRHVSRAYERTKINTIIQRRSQKVRNESTLWQRRYWEHLINDANDFNRHMDYIHWNPVKHGYTKQVIDWPYSSFHRLLNDGVYTENWCGDETNDDRESFGE